MLLDMKPCSCCLQLVHKDCCDWQDATEDDIEIFWEDGSGVCSAQCHDAIISFILIFFCTFLFLIFYKKQVALFLLSTMVGLTHLLVRFVFHLRHGFFL
jgi:hypothetical protein